MKYEVMLAGDEIGLQTIEGADGYGIDEGGSLVTFWANSRTNNPRRVASFPVSRLLLVKEKLDKA